MRPYDVLAMIIMQILAVTSAVAEPRLTFHAGFDSDERLVDYAGGSELAACRRLELVPGKFGKALWVGTIENDVWMDTFGNLDKARGTLSVWYKPDADAMESSPCPIFSSDTSRKRSWMGLRLFFSRGGITFDTSHPEGGIGGRPTEPAEDGWIHIAATWDCETGIQLFLNGRRASKKELTWIPYNIPAMLVGAGSEERWGSCAKGLIDDLKVYSEALGEDQIEMLYRGELDLPRGKVDVQMTDGVVPIEQPSGKPVREVFRLSFENGFDAVSAAGSGTPINLSAPEIVDGIRGKGARFRPGNFIQYAEKGNLNKPAGTISLWYRADWDEAPGERVYLLREEGPGTPGSNTVWLWFWRGGLRFDLRDRLDSYCMLRSERFGQGRWRHIVVSWDCRRNRTVYIDGKLLVTGRARGDSGKGFLPLTWDAKEHPSFFVGAENETGKLSAHGTIDELLLFDGMMMYDQVRELYGSYVPIPVQVDVPDRYPYVGRMDTCELRIENLLRKPLELSGTFEVLNSEAKVVEQGEIPRFSVGPAETVKTKLRIRVLDTLPHTLRVTLRSAGRESRHEVALWPVQQSDKAVTGELKLKLLEKVDLTAELESDTFLDSDGRSRVVESPLGRYREADGEKHSRFAVRFRVRSLGKTHRVVWKYPDDKPRTIDVILQHVSKEGSNADQDYTVHAGVFTGDEYPPTNKMIEQGAFFWPTFEDNAIIFMTAHQDHPAAVSEVAIYEVEGELPQADIKPYRGNVPARSIGIYYEDPVLHRNLATDPTFPGYRSTGDRLVSYMGWFGQDLLMYPTVWYHGPLYDSEVEMFSRDLATGRPHPPFFLLYLAKRLNARDMKFVPLFNVHQLASLNAAAVLDEQAVRGGTETPLNVRWNNHLKTFGWHGTDPHYNCLNPLLQKQVSGLVREQVDMLKGIPAFKGIVLHVTRHALLSFGSLDSGYNDSNLAAFQKDTGVHIPVGSRDPYRFFKSYKWLVENAKEDWIDWRCGKLCDFYAGLAKIITDTRPDAKLFVKGFVDQGERVADTYRNEDGYYEVLREAGVDYKLLAKAPGISFQRTIFPSDYRWRRSHRAELPDHADRRTINLATRTYLSFAELPDIGLNMHDRYWEDPIGRNNPMKNLWGAQEHGWRVSTLNPSPAYILEDYSAPLGSADLFYITKGGFVLGFWGVEEPVCEFSRAFRALPAAKFQNVPGLADPAAVRCAEVEGVSFFYAVNRFHHPVTCLLQCEGDAKNICDLASGESQAVLKPLKVELGPFQLRSFRAVDGSLKITGGEEVVDEKVPSALLAKLDELSVMLGKCRGKADDPAEFEHYLAGGRRMAEEKHWAELYYLLQEAWAKRLEQEMTAMQQ